MTALIFGGGGQDGYYLSRLFQSRGVRTVPVSRRSENTVAADVGDFARVEALVAEHQPDYVLHLAANSVTRHDALFENHATIVTGTLNVLEAVRRHRPQARVFVTGSGLQFRNAGGPVSERAPFEANSAYSAARIASVYAARYFRSKGLRVYVGYLFHHESPLRKPHHVSQTVALAARRIGAGGDEVLELGDLTVRKEWTFAGDVARAVLTLLRQDAVFEAAIGSGVACSIEQWVEACFSAVGKDWHDHVRVRPGFKAEYPLLVSDPSTMKALSWAPQVGMRDLAGMMVTGAEDGSATAGASGGG